MCRKVNIVLGKNYSQSVTNSLLVSCEDEDQPELLFQFLDWAGGLPTKKREGDCNYCNSIAEMVGYFLFE